MIRQLQQLHKWCKLVQGARALLYFSMTTDTVKKLRDMTGISVMQCKQALDEAKGDFDKALVLLRKKGAAIAAKKADRSLGAGVVSAYIHGGSVGSMVTLHSETDFVAKNEEFVALAKEIAMQVAAGKPEFVRREDIPEERMKEIAMMYEGEVKGKPENLKEQILKGKIDAYLKGVVLMEQPFIKDDSKTIRDLIEAATQKFGERIEVGQIARMSAK